MKLYSCTANASQQSRWGIIDSPPWGIKMLIMDKKSNGNKVFNMFLRKAKEHRENIEIKANIDIFHELFRIIKSFKHFPFSYN